MSENTVSLCRARAAKISVISKVRSVADVQGAGITLSDNGYAVKINLREMPEGNPLPDNIDGVSILYSVTGNIRKLNG